MGQLIIHQERNRLELSGFFLEVGDQVEILHLGFWLGGTVAQDQQGWFLRSSESSEGTVRFQTGLTARLIELA